ncbi:hypothetical protein IOD14_43975 (plasmid) [Streptomyces sp. A2-16]|uniref:hypothetical protein n=1 Tax=Streptomyces sp. A2-16 TaxID=2781734 RepID=UPI001BAEEAD9|nr:hypothetical protein [Streptomyces sp. A2-16]QUC63808.1 hypothetical protein IOD14_43975 [Streptomyces sp. A2-16]
MATRDDLHRLVEELPASDIELAADVLDALTLVDAAQGREAAADALRRQEAAADELRRAVAAARAALLSLQTGLPGLRVGTRAYLTSALPALPEPPYPRSVGSLTRAPADLSSNLDDYLADGFGQ